MVCLAHPRPGYAARAPQFAIGLLACLFSWILAGSANSLAAAEPAAVPADHAARMQQGLALFREHVRPLLTNHCLDCHGGKSTKADFSLATRESLFDSGHIDDTADTSYFFLLAAHEEEPFMPLNKPKLS